VVSLFAPQNVEFALLSSDGLDQALILISPSLNSFQPFLNHAFILFVI
jgi:hypothetical protein